MQKIATLDCMVKKHYIPLFALLLLFFLISSCRKSGCPASQQLAEYEAGVQGKTKKAPKFKTESGIVRETKNVNSRKRRRKASKRKLYKK